MALINVIAERVWDTSKRRYAVRVLNAETGERKATYPWYNPKRPRKSQRFVTLNCYRYIIHWRPDCVEDIKGFNHD